MSPPAQVAIAKQAVSEAGRGGTQHRLYSVSCETHTLTSLNRDMGGLSRFRSTGTWFNCHQ